MLVMAFPLVRVFGKLLSIPQHLVTAGIVVFGIVGAVTVRGNPLDAVTAVAFGLLGLVFRMTGFPLAPLVIGLVLGPQFEQNLRRGMLLNDGNFLAFFIDGPIAAFLFLCVAVAVALPLIGRFGLASRIVARQEGETK